MHTPEQALNLWCPMSRVTATDRNGKVVVGQSVFNRLDLAGSATWPESANCIGDKCAMWRWGSTDSAPPPNATPGALYVAEKVQSTTHGYCGLAGTPWSAAA